MNFETLALVTVLGLVGPLLALPKRWALPVVVGELFAGIIFGRTGFDVLDASNETFTFMADIGFALVMFVVGTHVPVRDRRLLAGIKGGILRMAVVAAAAVGLAFAVTGIFGGSHTALYVVLMASSSAAVVLPIVDSLGINGASVVKMLPQVAMADALCIVALPLAIDTKHAAQAAVGAAAVIAACVAVFLVLRWVENSGYRKHWHDISEEKKLALELRISLMLLFAVAALATSTHVSTMLAGFGIGLAVAAVGEPRRLARQLFALTDGFAAPLFFVWLGASLNLRELGSHPSMIGLGAALGVGAIAAHLVPALMRQPVGIGVLAAGQLGVPIAAVTLGESLDLLRPGEGSAMLLGALITVGAGAMAAVLMARRVLADRSGAS